MGIPDHLTCLLRNLYAGQESTVRTRHGTTDWFQIGKGVHQGCILSPCLFNFYAEYIRLKARLNEAQAGIKTAGRNINNLRYADDTTLMAESTKELKSFWMKVKEESENADFLKHSKNKNHGIRSHYFRANRWGNNANGDTLSFLGLQKSLQMVTEATKLRHLLFGRKAMKNLDSILKSRDIYLVDKSPNSQSYRFASSQVWM